MLIRVAYSLIRTPGSRERQFIESIKDMVINRNVSHAHRAHHHLLDLSDHADFYHLSESGIQNVQHITVKQKKLF